MSTILLSIGSNTFAKTNIDKAKRMLTRLFPGIIFSQPVLTEPDDEKYSYLFRNVLAKVETGMIPEEIIDKIKQTERAVGRTPKDKYLGKVVIDIDLIKYNEEILRPLDYQREYVQQLLSAFPDPLPADISPAKESSSEEMTSAKAPAAEAPADEAPADETPADEAPVEKAPPTDTN
jgi:2-amino-4-hydroxy-6-hydroxymethyldihydropteridine diphosphokinase